MIWADGSILVPLVRLCACCLLIATLNAEGGSITDLPADIREYEDGFKPVLDPHGNVAVALKGIWLAPNYGFVLDLTAARPEVFIQAARFCWRTNLARDPIFNRYYLQAYRMNGSGQAILQGPPGGTQYKYERIDALPPASSEDLATSPGGVFDAFWAAMNERYAFFTLHGINWSERRDRYRLEAMTAKSDAALYSVLKASVSGFRDPHLRINAEFDGKQYVYRETKPEVEELGRALQLEKHGQVAPSYRQIWAEWVNSQQARVNLQLLSGRATRRLNGHMLWGLLDNNVGYISINSMENFVEGDTAGGPNEEDAALAAREVDYALETLGETRAIIVDVSQNRGGDDRIGRVIASRFTDKKRVAYMKNARGGATQTFYLSPAGPRQFLRPVYLLTSRLTGSAAEVFALAMRALPNTCQVGEQTTGAFSDALQTPLPNGWMVTISNEIYRDPAGNCYEGIGAPPARHLSVFPSADPAGGHINAIREIIGLAIAAKTPTTQG